MSDLIGVLADMRNGQTVIELNQKFDELLRAVLELRAKGSVKITLAVSPRTVADDGRVIEVDLVPSVSLNKPERPMRHSMMFVSADGALTRQDPAQGVFDLQEVQQHGQ